jgi:hypothetical protein
MTSYITEGILVNFRCVFKGILAYLVSGPKSTPGLPWAFMEIVLVEIMPEKVILDHKKS